MITDDKKSILERVNFFCAFFIWSDPKAKTAETGNDTEEKKESGSTLIFGLFHLIGFFNVKQKRALGALRKISVFSMFDVSLTATATVVSK